MQRDDYGPDHAGEAQYYDSLERENGEEEDGVEEMEAQTEAKRNAEKEALYAQIAVNKAKAVARLARGRAEEARMDAVKAEEEVVRALDAVEKAEGLASQARRRADET